ncbi:hypothetical protein pdam_00011006 [Pocillopora damicornis]|uniref:NAD(P)-binding domain-containing protein n=2 Tax=Pocillopora TaxID=46730 RepID=A0A3M6U433_POCDA|nr:flavin reductase (NADPH)-like [Pocillopora damicornis]XP_058968327.1 flavin reductase (NADPH)-like [Pocillopora verrucosa]RMX48420.1 hypothetical protein pdam_00011006 [Pocillopora damicornis]CAH3035537.1 unnamed protein product [Pocillopora meandrina]
MATAAELLFPKLVVFGATGPTGLAVVQQALEKGHAVTAVARNPESFPIKQENLEVVKGDIFDVESLVPIIEGKNAVLSCLGFHKGTIFSPTTLYSKSITPITSAMERTGVGRLVCMTGIYTQKDPSNPRLWDWFGRPLARAFINDMVLMENIVMKSNICYTIVRPPILTKGPLTETNYVVAEGQSVPRSAWRVSRADVAHFMLKSLQSNEWDNKGVAIAGKK